MREGKASRWQLPDSLRPAGDKVETEIGHAMRARVRIDQPPALTFELCVEARHLEQWSGENAASDPRPGGTFRFDVMGRTCRGIYPRYHPPSLLVLHWGFADGGRVPVPADLIETTLLFSNAAGGTDIEVTQLAANADEAEFFAIAWADRLRRLQDLAAEL